MPPFINLVRSPATVGIAILLSIVWAGPLVPLAWSDEPAKTATGRDWTKHPAVLEVETTADIYAIGDIHGDFDRLVTLLKSAGLIGEDPAKPELIRWKADKAVLVITGDTINKGDQSLQVLVALKALQRSAREAGGQVVVLSGNHEAEFLASGGSSKKAAEFAKELRAREIDPEEVAQGLDKLGLGEFLRSLPFAARVNDWFFAHAGNTQGRTLKKLQADLQEGVDTRGYKADVLLDPNSLLEARLHPMPWWDREGEKSSDGEARLAEYARALGVKHFVLGHQPGKLVFADQTTRAAGEIFQKYDGLVFLIDVGMSRGVGYSTGAILHIDAGKHDKATALFPDGTSRDMWPKVSR